MILLWDKALKNDNTINIANIANTTWLEKMCLDTPNSANQQAEFVYDYGIY